MQGNYRAYAERGQQCGPRRWDNTGVPSAAMLAALFSGLALAGLCLWHERATLAGFVVYLPSLVYFAQRPYSLRIAALLKRAPEGRSSWLLFPMLLVLLPSAIATSWLITALLVRFAPGVAEAIESVPHPMVTGSPITQVLEVVLFVIVAPVMEELVFRVVLFERLADRLGATTGLVLSAVAFALLHLDPIGAFAFAMAMSAVYVRSGSIRPAIVAHGAYNAAALIITLPVFGFWDSGPLLAGPVALVVTLCAGSLTLVAATVFATRALAAKPHDR